VPGDFMSKKITFLLIIIFSFFSFSLANAWDRVGHQIIAAIALKQLTPAEQKYFNDLLHQFSVGANDDLISVSSWADELRNDGVSTFNSWHYIDIPFNSEKKRMHLPKIPSSNIVNAISEAEKVLINENTKPWEKSFFLRFLIHLVGDIHQPLHCSTRISQRFLAGDRGGQDYYIKWRGQNQPLHVLWDWEIELYPDLNRNPDLEKINSVAKALEKEYPKEYFQKELAETDFYQWAEEGFLLARNFVYQTEEGKQPTAAYLVKARELVKKRLVLAGYRLGMILDKIYRSGGARSP
jgi:hypothetical protein